MRPEWLTVLPVVVPLTAAALCIVAWRRPRLQRRIALTALASVLAVSVSLVLAVTRGGPLELAIGGWHAPVGVVFRADLLSALMTLVTGLIAVAFGLYARADLSLFVQRAGVWPLVLLLITGVCGSFLTADLFNLFVWFEVMLIASFVLLGLGGRRRQLASNHIYLVLSLIGSTLFLIAIGLTYASVRSLELVVIGERMAALAVDRPGLVLAIEALLLVSFGLKAAVFPLMAWLPASYHVPATSISALFAALLTKVGVYAMFRIAAGVFPASDAVYAALAAVAIATMLCGVLGALAQGTVRRILGFHIVSQIGYMVAGLALVGGSPAAQRLALGAAIFYVLHHIVVKANLFLIAGILRRVYGSESLDRLRGVARTHPLLAGAFLVSALSLAGVPPLSGFWAKLAIITAGVEQGAIALVAVAVAVGLLTLLSMLKIWNGVFAGEPAETPGAHPRVPRGSYAAVCLLAAVTLAIGLSPQWLFALAFDAAAAVLGGAP
jgi:multicomponent Na+:H+ antiporter subunit D